MIVHVAHSYIIQKVRHAYFYANKIKYVIDIYLRKY